MCWQGGECHGNKRVPGELLAMRWWQDWVSQSGQRAKKRKRLQAPRQRTLLLDTCSSRTSSSPPPLGREGISLTSLFLTVLRLTVWLRHRGGESEDIQLKKSPIYFQNCSVLFSNFRDKNCSHNFLVMVLFNRRLHAKTQFQTLLRN